MTNLVTKLGFASGHLSWPCDFIVVFIVFIRILIGFIFMDALRIIVVTTIFREAGFPGGRCSNDREVKMGSVPADMTER